MALRDLVQRSRAAAAAGTVALAVVLASCGGGGGASTTPPMTTSATPVPASAPTAAAFNAAAFTCPTSQSALSVGGGGGGTAFGQETRRAYGLHVTRSSPAATGLLAVTYSSATASSAAATIAAHERGAGANLVQTFDFSRLGIVTHVVAVPPAQMATAEAALRAQPGVQSVAPTGFRRYPMAVTTPYFPNDPYFDGFRTTIAPTSGSTPPPATYDIGPYEESASVPGQWDMHAIGLENAFAYSQPNNGSSVQPNSGALGLSAVKIAIIDTGEDASHPELSKKIVYQHCYITNPSGAQSQGTFATDPDGHGTDVAGIAAADTGNNFGFTGAGGNVDIDAYRVFPTPDDNCTSPTTSDPQCSSNTSDIAAAINDAVNQNVNVISMSLGGGTCGTGPGFAKNGDDDPVEGAAVANAIIHNIIVVAAAGNGGTSGVTAPACDTGVIAVGASALGDGVPNGSGTTVGTAGNLGYVEYVASYSQYGSPGEMVQNASAWGIVAPGGDPTGNSDVDDLHWIENIWTSTPYESSPSDQSFQGDCSSDYDSNSPADCRTLIAGTSMATPHVAGAAALILSVNPSYQNPTLMKQLLCSTADDIQDQHQGCGRLNVYNAMAVALHDPAPPAPIP